MKCFFQIYKLFSRRFVFLTIFLISLAYTTNAQLLQWNTFGNAGTETTEPSVFNDPNISSANLTQGSITAATNANRFGGSAWSTGATSASAVTGNDYIQFVVTPNSTCSVTPTSFVFSWQSSGTGPTNVALRSSFDGFAADIGTQAVTGTITQYTINITGIANYASALTFRLYGYGASAGTGTGGFDCSASVVNVQLNGTTSCGGGCTPPTTQSSALGVTDVSCTSVTIDWTRGNGSEVLITGIAGASSTTSPSNGTTYTGNSIFTAGTNVGGGYAIYTGTGTSVTVTGLSGNTQYTFAAYEYNTTGTCYLTPPATITFTTTACSGSQCPYITSSLINSCEGACGEGDNEIIFMNSGSYSFAATPANIAISYGNSSPPSTNYTNSFSTNASTISTLNTAAGCGTLFVDASSGSTIPSGSSIMLVKTSLCPNAYDWTALCGSGPIYVLFSSDADWAAGGNFVNGGSNPTIRYFESDFSNVDATCVTQYNYNAALLSGGNGAFIAYGSSGGSPASYTNTGCALSVIVLPVIIKNFSCEKENNVLKLTWETEEEHNVQYYKIERSIDGQNFMPLLQLAPDPSIRSLNAYTAYDEQPYSGYCYYRISSVDNDGYTQYHKIIGFDFSNQTNTEYTVSYNAENNSVIIGITERMPAQKLLLFNLAGQKVAEYTAASSGNIIINAADLQKGLYLIRLINGNKVYNDKIIIH